MGLFNVDDEVKALRKRLEESLIRADAMIARAEVLTNNLDGLVSEVRSLLVRLQAAAAPVLPKV